MENSKKKCQEQIWYTARGNKIYSESVSLDFLELSRILIPGFFVESW